MKYSIFTTAAFALGLAVAQDLSPDDFPSQCVEACTPVASQAVTCDAENDDDDAELDCICNGPDMSTAIPQCNACVAPFRSSGDDDDDYDDLQDLVNACGFASVSVSAFPSVTAVATSTFTTTSTDDDGEVETDVDETTIFSTVSGSVPPVSSTVITTTNDDGDTITSTSLTTPVATGANAGSGDDNNNDSSTPNFAMQTAAPVLGAGAALALGALAVL